MGEQLSSKQERAEQIARVNDAFRRAGPGGGDWYITPGVQDLANVPGLVDAVIAYDDFHPDIDPYGEHDMGRIMWEQEKCYWKIDYYDQARQYGLDPLDPECRRVITILLAEEY